MEGYDIEGVKRSEPTKTRLHASGRPLAGRGLRWFFCRRLVVKVFPLVYHVPEVIFGSQRAAVGARAEGRFGTVQKFAGHSNQRQIEGQGCR